MSDPAEPTPVTEAAQTAAPEGASSVAASDVAAAPSVAPVDIAASPAQVRSSSISTSSSSASAAAASSPVLSAPDLPPAPHARTSSVSSDRSNSSPSSPVASNASFRRQLQSIRASDLEQEHTIWTHAYAAEESFWLKQEERYQLLLKRAAIGASSSRDLLAYLRKSSKLLAGLSETLQGLGSFGSAETGTMRVACMSIDIVRKTTSSYLGELNTRVFGESVRAAAVAAEEAAKLHSTVETAGQDMVRQLKAQRRATNDAWVLYYRQGQERAKAEAAGIKIKSDPFLLARTYEHELYQLQTVEMKFQSLMASLLKDLQAEDAKRLNAMKTLLVDNLTAQKAVLEHSVKFTDNALTTVKAINPEADGQEFTQAADLYITPSDAAAAAAASSSAPIYPGSVTGAPLPQYPGTVVVPKGAGDEFSVVAAAAAASQEKSSSSAGGMGQAEALASSLPMVAFLAPPPARDPYALARVYAHEIEKEGSLSRQGNIIKSNWKPMHASLTSSGFLHLFEGKERKTAHSSFVLADAQVESGEAAHPLAFALRYTKSGFSLGSKETVIYFKADNSDQLSEWVLLATKHQQAQPKLTIVQQTAAEEKAATDAANA